MIKDVINQINKLNMNNIFNYICCLGRSEKNINWTPANEDPETRNYNTEINSSTSCSHRCHRGCVDHRKIEWDESRDQELLRAFQEQKGDLRAVQDCLSHSKTKTEIQQRYKRITNNKQRNMWSQEEDLILLDLYKNYGPNWQSIAFYLKERSGKQVRDRYINILDPEINKGHWTPQEDRVILEHYELLGPKWSKISVNLKGRPENMVKNRWYSYIKKRIEQYRLEGNKEQEEISDMLKTKMELQVEEEGEDEWEMEEEVGNQLVIKNVKKEVTLGEEEMSERGGDFQLNQQMEIENEIQNQNNNSQIQHNLLRSSGQMQNTQFDSNNTQYCSLYPNNYEYQQPTQTYNIN